MEVDSLFQIGENVMYATQGPGVIKGIEEREFSGEMHQYYIIEMIINRMQLMIPVEKMTDAPIRPITNIKALNHILDTFTNGQSESSDSWKERYQKNITKMNSGDLEDCVEVVRDLSRMKQEKTLNKSEKEMLTKAYKIMMSEMKLIEGITPQQLENFHLSK